MRSSGSLRIALLALALVCGAAAVRAASPRAEYMEALGREALLRRDLDARPTNLEDSPLLRRIRGLVTEYERLAKRYPRSGYSDNALFQAAVLSADAFWFFGEDPDRRAALRLFAAVRARFPTSSLIKAIPSHAARLEAARPAPAAAPADSRRAAPPQAETRPVLTAIRREVLPDALRVTLELERETPFRDERLDGPPRVFVDLQNARVVDELRDATLGFPDDVVRQIRVGRHVGAARVVLDLHESARHSVYPLYDPYRIVIDFERGKAASAGEPGAPGASWTAEALPPAPVAAPADAAPAPPAGGNGPADAAVAGMPPAPPSTNRSGGFSIARQLGLGISRVVIDAGHGGHDPGAKVKGLNEAELTLDVAQRLEKLLLAVPGVEVIMTRRTNVYIPLEERTAIANRAGADLFLSIHANASRTPAARGIETYFLNFAPNPEAEAIAARENAGSARTMSNLPDIVKAIALNNKIDESRDFAALVQSSMMDRLRKVNREARNLGVKQAPFMVLIGATMPSVLAEISFITNRQEATLLRTPGYRQAIAEALFNGISKYQKSLKAAQTVAAQ
jgi:N-acetylmuramoyl-L-alanine amidase